MKKYFLYQLKKCILPLAVLTAFAMIAYVLPLAVQDYEFWNRYYDSAYISLPIYTEYIMTALGVICAVVPIYTFSYKMKKRSVDMYYSLPLSKTKILAVHFITGFLTVLVAYSAAYWLGFILMYARISKLIYLAKRLNFIYYLWLYLGSIIPAFIIYALSAFAFTRANTVWDGIIFIILTHFALFAVASCVQYGIEVLRREYTHYINPGAFVIWGPLGRAGEILGERIVNPDYSAYSGWSLNSSWSSSEIHLYDRINDIVAFSIISLAAVGATVAMFLTEKNCKAENCGQISGSIFGYKPFIPLYTVTAMAICTLIIDTAQYGIYIISWIIISFLAYILTAVYRRNLKIGKNGLIMLAASVGTGLITSIVLASIL